MAYMVSKEAMYKYFVTFYIPHVHIHWVACLCYKFYHDYSDLSHHVGKPTICIGENKGADQLRSNCEADQRLCFRYSDSTIPLLLKPEISSF